MKDGQASLAEDDVRGFARHVGRAHDRNPDVGGAQRGRVVDAVAEVPHDVAAVLERQDDPVLPRRCDSRVDIRLLDDMAHARVIEPFDLVTCDGHRRDHGQDFRREADAQGDGKEQCLEGVPPERDADEQNEQHEDDSSCGG